MNDTAARALSLGMRASEALTARYRKALAWRKAHPGRSPDAEHYFPLRDHDTLSAELRRIERMTPRGAIRALTDFLERFDPTDPDPATEL